MNGGAAFAHCKKWRFVKADCFVETIEDHFYAVQPFFDPLHNVFAGVQSTRAMA